MSKFEKPHGYGDATLLGSFRGPDQHPASIHYTETLRDTLYGNMALASATSGIPYDNQKLLELILENDPDQNPEKIMEAIVASGFTRRYAGMSGLDMEQVTYRVSTIASALIYRVKKSLEWDSVDHLIVTSAFLPNNMVSHVANHSQLAYRATTSSYRLACAGAVTAFIDTLANPELQDKRVAVLALEPLSFLMDTKQITTKNAAVSTIFGDDYAGIGFRPRDYELVSAKTHVIPDGGVIRVKTRYTVPEPHTVPDHYTIDDGALQDFAYSPEGVFYQLPAPNDQNILAEMSPSATMKFFMTHTPPVIIDVFTRAATLGVIPRYAIVHQPSEPVYRGIIRKLNRDYVLPEDFFIPPFLLGEIGRSNSSSATTLVIWQHLAEQGLINPREPFLLCAPGIGAVITAAVIQPRN